MRELTFEGFLRRYLRGLSNGGTLSLYKLAEEAAGSNPRLREPLLLYALFSDKTELLLKAVKDQCLKQEYLNLLNRYDKDKMQLALSTQSSELGTRYLKVWRSYVSQKNRLSTDDEMKLLMHRKIRSLQEEKQVSNYRLCKDLKLNPGNLNAYLKHRDSSKLSLNTSRRVLHYLETR